MELSRAVVSGLRRPAVGGGTGHSGNPKSNWQRPFVKNFLESVYDKTFHKYKLVMKDFHVNCKIFHGERFQLMNATYAAKYVLL